MANKLFSLTEILLSLNENTTFAAGKYFRSRKILSLRGKIVSLNEKVHSRWETAVDWKKLLSLKEKLSLREKPGSLREKLPSLRKKYLRSE